MINFDVAFSRLISHEGDFTDDPRDDGNWTGGKQGRGELKGTKFGIAANTYPHLDIKNLTLAQAKSIYKEDFWDVLGDDAHPSLRFQLFDAAVNHGHSNAVRFLQRAIGVADDGAFGNVSKTALKNMQCANGHNDILLKFNGYRFRFWASLKTFDTFGRGWVRRGAENLLLAAEDN